MSDIKTALEAQQQAEAALEAAKRNTREIALRQLREAQEVCRIAGINVEPTRRGSFTGRKHTDEVRERIAAASRARWANKSAEERAAWGASISEGHKRGGEAVQ